MCHSHFSTMTTRMRSTRSVTVLLTATFLLVCITRNHFPILINRGRRLGLKHAKGIGRYYRDPATQELKPVDEIVLLPDGVLFEKRLGAGRRKVCDYFLRPEPNDPPIARLHFHFPDCLEPQLGNRLGEIYGRMLLANAHRVPYTVTCGVPEEGPEQVLVVNAAEKQVSMIKLLQMDEDSPGIVPRDTLTGQVYTAQDVCATCRPAPSWQCKNGLDMVSDKIRKDMWRVMQTDQGRSFVPDDAVIHLRLGDALSAHGDHDEGIGVLPHKAYSQLLRDAEREKGPIRTISIVTMPFTYHDVRAYERNMIDRSRLVTEDLVRHLATEFPSANVTIHNGHDEVPAKAYARLTRAKVVAVCGSSTFCTDPVLAVRDGIGYIFRAEKHSPWAVRAATKYDNIRTYKVPRLANNYIHKLSNQDLLRWLREQDPNAGEVVVDGPPLIRLAEVIAGEQ